MRYVFRITLISSSYDANEKLCEDIHAILTQEGTEDSVVSYVKTLSTQATQANIERVAVAGGPVFQSHEIKIFSVGI